jgi:hypothetical protein
MLYSAIRRRPLTLITTSTTLVVPRADWAEPGTMVDDGGSAPLRHALIQRSDFYLEVDRFDPKQPDGEDLYAREPGLFDDPIVEPNTFTVRAYSAIQQPIPGRPLLWSREKLVLYEF